VRIPGTDRFIISGTQTGHIDSLMPEHCARVSSFAIGENSVTCDGPVPASSETLSHAAIYSGCRDAGAVVHGHDHSAWIRHRGFASVPSVDAAAGTAELARQLAGCATSMECTSGIIVMRGHPDGLVAFGDSLGVAVLTMLAAVR
jgi:ribulose-5-phosphate 4-epimerase/fuculose-1-phosphate aldolase